MRIISRCKSIQKPFLKMVKARDPSKSLIQAPMCTQSPWTSLYWRAEVIYSSGAIYPNQFVENVALATPLAKGEYPAKATINIYDPESKEKQGVTEAELTIIVKN